MSSSVAFTASGGGKFEVQSDQSAPSYHVAEREACEEATNRLLAGETSVEYVHSYRVRCVLTSDVPSPEIRDPSLLSGYIVTRVGDSPVLHFEIDYAGRVDNPWITAKAGIDLIAQGYGPDVPAVRLLDVETLDVSVTAGWPGESFELGTVTLEVRA